MSSIGLNTEHDAAVTTRDDGLNTLTMVHNHRVVSQSVRSRLLHWWQPDLKYQDPFSVHWEEHLRYPEIRPTLGVEIRALVLDTDYVQFASIDEGTYDIEEAVYSVNGDTLSVSNVCFISDCCGSQIDQVVDL